MNSSEDRPRRRHRPHKPHSPFRMIGRRRRNGESTADAVARLEPEIELYQRNRRRRFLGLAPLPMIPRSTT